MTIHKTYVNAGTCTYACALIGDDENELVEVAEKKVNPLYVATTIDLSDSDIELLKNGNTLLVTVEEHFVLIGFDNENPGLQ